MAEIDPGRIALRFVNEINRHDLEALEGLMAPDFRWVDPSGQETLGRDRGCAAWAKEFRRTPDLRLAIHDHLCQGSVIALFGTASGTRLGGGGLPRQHWVVPTAWRVVVRDARIAEWQVFSPPEPDR